MTNVTVAERRNEVLAGVLVAATILLVGYASGFGHLLGAVLPGLPSAEAAPAPGSVHRSSVLSGVAGTAFSTSSASTSSAIAGSEPGDGQPTMSAAGASRSATAPDGDGCDPGLAIDVFTPFWTHVERGHLDESPGQQVEDVLDTDRYVRSHTVLVEAMVSPLYAATTHATDAVSAFWLHVKHGHLDESVGQQVEDVLDTDEYVRTHTVLIEDTLDPTVTTVAGSC